MGGAAPPLPQCAFIAWCLVKHRDKGTTLPLPLPERVAEMCSLSTTGRSVQCIKWRVVRGWA